MDDKIHRLADYKGKTVIINFWATWCPPCRAELPSMNRAWSKIKGDDIEMIAINIGEDEDAIFAFTAEYPIDFTVLLDENSEQIQNWQMTGLPTTYVLDPQGRVVYQAVGDREWDNDKILDKIRTLNISTKETTNKKSAKKVEEK
jgi:peroxiredoxin